MKLNSFKHCPYCGNYIETDTVVYTRGNLYLGCDMCVDESYQDADDEDFSLFFQEQGWETDKINERFGL